MSQPPIYYESSNPYPQPPSPRPPALSVLAIIGIVFGSLGLLCLGAADLFAIVGLADPHIAHRFQEPPVQRIANLILGFCGLILSGVLLYGSINSLRLIPAARKLMLRWAVFDLIYDLLKMLLGVLIFLPRVATNPALQQQPNAQQFIAFAKIAGTIGALGTWLITTTFAVLILLFFKKPEIVNAFEQPPQPPDATTANPPPPM